MEEGSLSRKEQKVFVKYKWARANELHTTIHGQQNHSRFFQSFISKKK